MEYALGLGYRWHPWTINLAGVRQEKAFKKLSPYHEPQDNKASKAKITLRYEQLNYKLYFHEGLSLRSEIKVDAFRSDEKSNATQFDIRAGWQETMFERQVLQVLVATGGTRGGAIHDSNRIGGGRGFRGIDAKTAWAESYGALAIDYQIPIAHYASGALTIAPFIDAGRIANRGGNNAIINYAAMGGGVYYFLKKIALPGLGLEYGYNTSYLKVFVAFSMGLSL